MSDLLPPPPPGTPMAWVDAIDGEIISATLTAIEAADLYPLRPGATRHPIPPATQMVVATAARSWCVVDGELAPRSESAISMSATSITADGQDEVIISGIPEGAVVQMFGVVKVAPTVVTGGSVTLTCSVPGKIHVQARCPAPYLDWMGTIHAV